jgi:hypothetical protein
LGYGPRAIAHAFSTLSGPGSVAEALEVLRAPMPESHPIALSFEVTETRGGPSAANRATITSVERDDSGIHVNYDIVPPLGVGSHGPQGEAKDDLGNDYHALGGHFGLTADGGSTDITYGANTRVRGRLTMPVPPPAATMLCNALGRVPLIDLGETSARSPRLASGLIEIQQSRNRRSREPRGYLGSSTTTGISRAVFS